jgi:Family of unknown function (DUF6460)
MAERLNRFLGDTPFRVFLKLVIISIIVGVVMRSFGWSALDVVQGIRTFIMRIWNMGFSAIEQFADYLILGAAIVIPAFLLLRLFAMRKN